MTLFERWSWSPAFCFEKGGLACADAFLWVSISMI